MEKEILTIELERINRKLDSIYGVIAALVSDRDNEIFDKELKEKEENVKKAFAEMEWHKENKRYMEERKDWRRRDWHEIDTIASNCIREINTRVGRHCECKSTNPCADTRELEF